MNKRIKQIIMKHLGGIVNVDELTEELAEYMFAVMDKVMEDTEKRCQIRKDLDDMMSDETD